MASTTVMGRPGRIALLNFQPDRAIDLLEEFREATSSFSYSDVHALSRALGISTRGIEKWKYGETFPDFNVAYQIIDWVNRGKPCGDTRICQTVTDML